ncbi:MAG: PKD domain-containing protein, partial [Bacteroidota bacterium]
MSIIGRWLYIFILIIIIPVISNGQCPPYQTSYTNCPPPVFNPAVSLVTSGSTCVGNQIFITNQFTPVDSIDATIIDWGDGSCTTYAGVNSPNPAPHNYNYPPDSNLCYPAGGGVANLTGEISRNIVMYCDDSCGTGLNQINRRWASVSATIKFRPHCDIRFPFPICLGTDIHDSITNYSCPNINSTSGFENALIVWDFGDGTIDSIVTNTSPVLNPFHIYANSGTYTVTLCISQLGTGSCGTVCCDNQVTILPRTIIDPVITNNDSCLPPSIILHPVINSENATSFNWTVNPGPGQSNVTNPTDSQPTITINVAGNYTIHAQVQGCCSSALSVCSWDTVLGFYNPPILNTSVIPDFCNGTTINPLDSGFFSVLSNNSYFISYHWDFPGGSPTFSDTLNPGGITYNTPGTYPITLYIETACGSDSLIDSLTILGPSAITADFPSAIVPCLPPSVQLTPQTTSQNISSYNWSVTPAVGASISNTAIAQPNFNFSVADTFHVEVTATGCCTIPSDCYWDTTFIFLNAPILDTSFIPIICIGNSISPVDSNYFSINTNNTNINSYQWSFPGGSPNTSANANPGSINYSSAGSFPVTLTVTHGCGFSVISNIVKVSAPTIIDVDFQSPLDTCISPVTADSLIPLMQFSNAYSFSWSSTPSNGITFNDSSLAQPVIYIAAPNTYLFHVASTGCCTDPLSICSWDSTIRFYSAPSVVSSPIPAFCNSAVINPLNYFSVDTTDASITGYQWDFQGSVQDTSTVANPGLINYNSPGIYIISFAVHHSCGQTVLTDTLEISTPPALSVSPDTLFGCNTLTVNFTNTPPFNGHYFEWNAGTGIYISGTDSISPEPSLQFNSPGSYTVFVSDSTPGCSIDTISFNALVCGPASLTDTLLIPDDCDTTNLQIDLNNFIALVPQACDSNYLWAITHNNIIVFSSATTNPPAYAVTDTGFYFVEASVTNYCGTVVVRDTFFIIPPTAIILPASINLCRDTGFVNLNNIPPSPAGGTWINMAGDTISSIYNPSNGSSADTLIYNLSYGGNCISRDSLIIHILGPPVNAGSDQCICKTGGIVDISLNVSPTGGVFSSPAFPAAITDSILYDPAIASSASDILIYTYFNSGCWLEDSVVITIATPPVPSASFPDTLCAGSNGTFINNTTPVDSVLWVFSGASIPSSTSASLQTGFPNTGTFTNSLYIYSSCGCKDTITEDVVIINTPLPSFTMYDDTICAGVADTFYNATINNSYTYYNWFFGNGQTYNGYNPSAINYLQGINDTVYYIQLIDSNRCGSLSFTDTLVVKPIPLPFFGALFNHAGFCSPDTVTVLNYTLGNPDSSILYLNGQLTNFNVPSVEYILTAVDTPTTYHFTLVAFNECGSRQMDTSFVINPVNYQACFNPLSSTVCVNDTAYFYSCVPPSFIVNWMFSDGTMGTGHSIPHVFSDTGKFVVTQIVSNGCGSTSDSIVINILPLPVVSFTADSAICNYLPVTFNNLSQGTFHNEWYFGDGNIDTISFNPIHTYAGPGTYATVLIAADVNNCKSSDTAIVIIRKAPLANFTLTSTYCATDNIVLNNLSVDADQYILLFGDTTINCTGNFPTCSVFYYSVDTPGVYTVSLTAISSEACEEVHDTTISIAESPVSAFTVEPVINSNLCNEFDTWQLTSLSTGAFSIEWLLGNDGQVFSNDSVVIKHFELHDELQIIHVAYNTGCTDTSFNTIIPSLSGCLIIPNAVEPNSIIPGKRIFLPVGINIKEGSYALEVYSKWGELLWWTDQLDDRGRPVVPFLGKDMHDHDLEQGSYIWRAKATFLNNIDWEGMS